MKKLVVGILAHVDAGKTTLSEAMLYTGGRLRTLGRVDHKDAFLDTYTLERERGITIFSKQAVLPLDKLEVTLLDTPGHVDFGAEMERTLQVLDYAILVISGSDGVQGHTETLWRLLERYEIPTFLFINKMDICNADKESLMKELATRLNDSCIDFTQDAEHMFDKLAMCDEEVMNAYLENETVEHGSICRLIWERKVFPCFFGSALKLDGVDEFLRGLQAYTQPPAYPKSFGARVFKIARDEHNNRLTYMKITGGSLRVRTQLRENEKVSQIRIYSGRKFVAVEEAEAGTVCAVTGLSNTFPGMGFGIEHDDVHSVLEPVLTYKVLLPEGCDVHKLLQSLRQLEEEDPQLHVLWNETLQEIQLQLMGQVQMEILQNMIEERFGVVVEFGTGNIVYKETISMPVEGVGHYEPLRHYAEVHLLMEPLKPGSGLVFKAKCSEDALDKNWQRLVLTHLEEREHVGVLTGSALTDMRITLIAGRAHQKHTEGGDFRQATYRAVRQGLMMTESVLLEPYYSFRLEVPNETVGRAMTDIQKRSGSIEPLQSGAEMSVLVGKAPAAKLNGYYAEVISYTKGRGSFSCEVCGYEPCHNAEEIIEQYHYDPRKDVEHPADSVFCSHGAGHVIPWNEVYEHMHIEHAWKPEQEEADFNENTIEERRTAPRKYSGSWEEDKELEAIFTRTFGPIKRHMPQVERRKVFGSHAAPENLQTQRYLEKRAGRHKGDGVRYLLVDGYNIVFAWEELNELAKINLDGARYKLMDILSNYQGYTGVRLICVFDAYKVKGNPGAVERYHNIDVVYTKEAETADMYIEKVTLELGRHHQVTVATSDRLEQLIIAGHGAVRISAQRLKEEVERIEQELRTEYEV